MIKYTKLYMRTTDLEFNLNLKSSPKMLFVCKNLSLNLNVSYPLYVPTQ